MLVEWRAIPGYEGIYEASNEGDIRSLSRIDRLGRPHKGRVLSQNKNPRWGYMQITLHKNGKSHTHRSNVLIASAFLGENLGRLDVNHLDGDKTNNCADNLEYCTRSENILHAVRNGLNPHIGETHPLAKLSSEQVAEIRKLSSLGVLGKDLAKRYGVGRAQISRILTGKRWSHL